MRKNIDTADAILHKKYKVLNAGYLALVDYCGGDEAIEAYARVSYGKETRKVSDTETLIRYLLRHTHTTPFESTELAFNVAMPIHVARQFFRHRTFSFNEYSGRYSVIPDTKYENYPLRLQSNDNKQGSADDRLAPEIEPYFTGEITFNQNEAFKLYDRLISQGVSREIARMHLPQNTYTYFFCKVDLNNLFKFLSLRTDGHAQSEIRAYANIMAGMVECVAPLAYKAWIDYKSCARIFSGIEMIALQQLLSEEFNRESTSIWLIEHGLSKRETKEFWDKIDNPIVIPNFSLSQYEEYKEIING